MEKAKRYLIFLIGLFINSMGVSLITKASLGTSPILSIPYVLSLNFPMTLGEFTILFSILLIAVQLLILKKNFRPEHWLQISISVAFGYFIDLTMVMFGFIQPAGYGENLIYLLVGCVVLGFGVYTEVLADVSMTVIAAVLALIFSHRLEGVREGTVIAALLVGFLARTFGKKLVFLRKLLLA